MEYAEFLKLMAYKRTKNLEWIIDNAPETQQKYLELIKLLNHSGVGKIHFLLYGGDVNDGAHIRGYKPTKEEFEKVITIMLEETANKQQSKPQEILTALRMKG